MEIPEEIRKTMELMLEACQEKGTVDKARELRDKPTWGRDLLWLAANNSDISVLSQSILAGELSRQPDLVCGLDQAFVFEAIIAILRQPRKDEENLKIAEMVTLMAVNCGLFGRLAGLLHENITPESDLNVLLLIRCYASLIACIHQDRDSQLQLFNDLVGLVSGWLDMDSAPPAIQTVVFSTLSPQLIGWELIPGEPMFYLLERAAQIMKARALQVMRCADQMNEEPISALLQCASACEDFISDVLSTIAGRKNIPEEYGHLVKFMEEYFTWAYENLPELHPIWRYNGFLSATLRIFGEHLPFVIEAWKDDFTFAQQICRIVRFYGEYFDEELFQTDAWSFFIDAYECGSREIVSNIYRMLLRANPVLAVRALEENIAGCDAEAVAFLLRSGMPIIRKSENAEALSLYRGFVCRLLCVDISKCDQRNLLSTMFLLASRTIELLPGEIAERWGQTALTVVAQVVGDVRNNEVTDPGIVTANAAFEYLYEWFGIGKRDLDEQIAQAALDFHFTNPPTSKHLKLIVSRGSLEFRVHLAHFIWSAMLHYIQQDVKSLNDRVRFTVYCRVFNDIMRSVGPSVIPQEMPQFFQWLKQEGEMTEVLDFLSTFSLIIKDPACWMAYLHIFADDFSCGFFWGNEIGLCMCCVLSQWGRTQETRKIVLKILLKLLGQATPGDLHMKDCVPVTNALCLILGLGVPSKDDKVLKGIAVLREFFLHVQVEGGDMKPLACLSLMELDIVCLLCELVNVDIGEVIEMIDYCWQNGLFVTYYHCRLFSRFCELMSSQLPIPRLIKRLEELQQGKVSRNLQFYKNFEEYLRPARGLKPRPPRS